MFSQQLAQVLCSGSCPGCDQVFQTVFAAAQLGVVHFRVLAHGLHRVVFTIADKRPVFPHDELVRAIPQRNGAFDNPLCFQMTEQAVHAG